MNLTSDMEARAKEAPDRTGLIFEDGREFTFKEVEELSSRSANFLKSLNIQKGSRVGIYIQNSPEFVMIMYGLWKIGAVLVPINIMYQVKELRHAITSTGIDIICTTPRNMKEIEKVRDFINTVILIGNKDDEYKDAIDYDKGILDASPVCDSFSPDEKDEASILFTGGTTGVPKAVITTHSGWYETLTNLARGLRGYPGPYPIEKPGTPPNIMAFPLFHSGGQQSFLFAYHVGRTVVLMERFRVEKYVELVEKYRISSLVLMPTMIHDLVTYEGPIDFSFVRSLLSIGQELPHELRKSFENRFNIPILMNYGSTEAGHVAGWSLKDVRAGMWKPGSVGKIYKGVEIEIRDENDKKIPPGEPGEICVKTKVTVNGYTDQKKDNKLLIKNGWLYMGDIGYLDDDNVLFLVGRKREMIKCGGFQVWPQELEDILSKHPKIKDVAVIGAPDERLGEIPKAFVVLKEKPFLTSQEEGLKKEIIDYCRDNIAHFKAIRAVKFIDQIPRSDTGKILKPKLKETDQKEQR